MQFLVHSSMSRILNFAVKWLYKKISLIFNLQWIKNPIKSIWHRSYIIWCLQSWWIWSIWSCQSFARQSSDELHRNIILKFHWSIKYWNHHWRKKSDLGWIFTFRINYECCRPCHCHCRLSRSSCSWYTLYKVNCESRCWWQNTDPNNTSPRSFCNKIDHIAEILLEFELIYFFFF